MMEVILKQEIHKLGGKGDVVRVANGYARNFLFPKQMALPATAANKKQIEEMRAAADREAARLRGDAAKLAEQLQALTPLYGESRVPNRQRSAATLASVQNRWYSLKTPVKCIELGRNAHVCIVLQPFHCVQAVPSRHQTDEN